MFIVFEGMDGSGKTTAIKKCYDFLKENNRDVVLIREPGSTLIAEKIRNVIVDKENTAMNKYTESLMFAAARSELVEKEIKPAIEAGKIILCDRYVYSSFVYQGLARGVDIKSLTEMHHFAPVPDLVVVLRTEPEVAMKRIADARQETNRLDNESMDFYKRIDIGYRSIKNLKSRFTTGINILTIDNTTYSPDETFETLKKTVLKDVLYRSVEVR